MHLVAVYWLHEHTLTLLNSPSGMQASVFISLYNSYWYVAYVVGLMPRFHTAIVITIAMSQKKGVIVVCEGVST